jgi:O-acetyl-ADP-ribose deacetylase (regulator of RNase III)
MAFQIIRDDITKVKADAIVNTANPDVVVGDGVDAAIYEAAGKEKLLKAREKIGELQPGEVGITPAFDLDARFIIHASGPWWVDGKHGEAKLLRQCYDRSLELARDNGCESIAFPLLATGTYGFPKGLGIQIAVDAFTSFLEENEMDITLVVFGSKSVQISGELALDVRHFIDDKYVEEKLEKEYSHDGVPGAAYNAPVLAGQSKKNERRQRGLGSLFRKNKTESRGDEAEESSGFANIPDGTEEELPLASHHDEMVGMKPTAAMAMSCADMSLDDALKDMYTDSFEKHLQQLINKKGLKNSEVYAAANISKQYFSKLIKGQVKPSKEKVLALTVGLKLNMDEAVDFLRLAGYALSPVSQTDVIVEYFIRHEDYNVMKIDIVLFDYGLDPLSG